METIAAGISEGAAGILFDLLAQTPDLIALFDAGDRLIAANPAFCAAYHCDPSDQLPWQEIMRANYRAKRGPIIETADIDDWLTTASARRASVPYRSFEAGLHGGRWLWITETLSPEGRMLFHASEISSLRSESRNLRLERDAARRASWTDALTGVPNRRYVMDRLEEWFEAHRMQADFGTHCLAVIDLDNFKGINDTHGHDFGDAVLVAFCREVVASIRPFDLFGRMGGEEFLFLMPNCPLDMARQRLDRLQQAIGLSPVSAGLPAIRYTFSAGLVAVQPDEDIYEHLRLADKLLYGAKADGRARVKS